MKRGAAWLLPIGTLVAVLVLAEWLKIAGALPKSVPAPSQVWAVFVSNPEVVFRVVRQTAAKAMLGYGAAAVIALLAASIAALVAVLRAPIYNLGVGLYSVPLIATAPLLALWLGTGPAAHTVIAGLACYFPMLVGAMQGFRAYERASMELFYVYSASRWQLFRFLVLPSSLPYLFAGFKLAAPTAVLGAITAEWAGADTGIGVFMLTALFNYDVNRVWLSVIAACLLAGAGYGLWALIERYAIYWETNVELRE